MADRIFYVEERRRGRWTPALYHGDMPEQRSLDGARRAFRAQPIEIDIVHHNLPLETLRAIYGGIITIQESAA